MDFEEWWSRVGQYLDPEPGVSWYDKRKMLMAEAFVAFAEWLVSLARAVEMRPCHASGRPANLPPSRGEKE